MSIRILLRFPEKDALFGVTRKTLQELSKTLGVSEPAVIHLALAKLAREVLPSYEADNGPLSQADHDWLCKEAAKHLPKNKVVTRKSLL